ncbi:dynein light chain Tctex-type protein 2B-like [Babylonia areolata]|uniref:dynein light chain Tctex-type protein 2B-like n=1 Tax=Babylonia areolata TaxID=304850 RepID=UPI003FD26D90
MNIMKKAHTRMTANSVSDRKSEMSDTSSHKNSKTRFKLKMKMMSSLGMAGMVSGSKSHTVVYENTYKTDPEDDHRFSQVKAEQIIYSVFENYLAKREYDAKRFPSLSKTLSELIKERLRDSGLDRYKIVSVVTLCENRDQGTRVASRCLWNAKHDNHASVVFEGANFFAVGSVYAVYFD